MVQQHIGGGDLGTRNDSMPKRASEMEIKCRASEYIGADNTRMHKKSDRLERKVSGLVLSISSYWSSSNLLINGQDKCTMASPTTESKLAHVHSNYISYLFWICLVYILFVIALYRFRSFIFGFLTINLSPIRESGCAGRWPWLYLLVARHHRRVLAS